MTMLLPPLGRGERVWFEGDRELQHEAEAERSSGHKGRTSLAHQQERQAGRITQPQKRAERENTNHLLLTDSPGGSESLGK